MVPYALVRILPLTIGRGQGPDIVTDLLSHLPISLRMLQSWVVCPTTWAALYPDRAQDPFVSPLLKPSWICVFTHNDRQIDPYTLLDEYCGPVDRWSRRHHHLRYRYTDFLSLCAYDDVVDISHPQRLDLESDLLLRDFDPVSI